MAKIFYNKISIDAEVGRDLLGQLLDDGVSIQYLCMAGSCGTCAVRVKSGGEHLAAKSDAELHLCRQPDQRLACQAVCLGTGDVVIQQ